MSTDPTIPTTTTTPATPDVPDVPGGGRKPVVIVDDVHVKYKVFATGKRPTAADRRSLNLKGRGKQMRTVHALKGVSFTAYENDSIGVIGTNGSGKSTLMRAIVGLTTTSDGAIYAASRPSLLGVGAALIRDLSGDRNIILGGLAMGFTMDEIEENYDDIVSFAGLEKFVDLPMRAYSSGMTARLKFAIASVKTHEILIVDEALAVGDRTFRQRSEARIREIRDNAGTVFLVSHSMKSIKDTCSRVIWLDQGTLIMDGDPDEVIAAYNAAQDK
ncbi:ABC transporter ATP-binding protein [Aeromicrobium stalagmiti]|uniref:ABC transporter ATP-binding protein n=1 Tax=Aeromicrobium stalagmiti TaxID=2738988 RepID=UPI003463C4D6